MCLLELVPQVPTPIRGRDEHGAGEMWNSNSIIPWLLARTGLDVESIRPPPEDAPRAGGPGIVKAPRQRVDEAVPQTTSGPTR
jgi:hypothetical protein